MPTDTILVLGGELSSSVAAQIKSFLPKRLLAVDQAYQKLYSLGLKPDFILGDFDSVDCSAINSETKKVELYDQDMTDFEKAIHYIRKNAWGRTSIFGLGGGELDHVIGNVQVLVKCFQGEDEYYFFDYFESSCKLGCLVNKRLEFSSFVGAKVSLFPFPTAVVNSRGLKYQLSRQAIFQNQGVLAVRNELKESKGVIEVIEGIVLVIFDADISSFPNF